MLYVMPSARVTPLRRALLRSSEHAQFKRSIRASPSTCNQNKQTNKILIIIHEIEKYFAPIRVYGQVRCNTRIYVCA